MALGKPVIGTIGASFEEIIIDGETGFLVPAGSMDALAAKLNEAWVHPRLDEIGRAASKKMEEFVPDRTVQDLLDYYALIQEEYVHRKQVDRPKLFKSGRQASNR
jgi:glycosyltransferase involved in cell wall biosynthesis